MVGGQLADRGAAVWEGGFAADEGGAVGVAVGFAVGWWGGGGGGCVGGGGGCGGEVYDVVDGGEVGCGVLGEGVGCWGEGGEEEEELMLRGYHHARFCLCLYCMTSICT